MKYNIQVARILAAAAILCLGLLVAAQASASNGSADVIAERLKPSGDLCL